MLQTYIKVWCIHTYKEVWRIAEPTFYQPFATFQQFWQTLEDLNQPHDRETLHREDREQTFGLHTTPTYTLKLDIGVVSFELRHQAGSENIPRLLSSHNGDTQCTHKGRISG